METLDGDGDMITDTTTLNDDHFKQVENLSEHSFVGYSEINILCYQLSILHEILNSKF